MTPNYNIIAFLTEDQRHSAYVIKGLLKLEQKGVVELEFKPLYSSYNNRLLFENMQFRRVNRGYPWCIEILITEIHSGRFRRIGIDLQDWTNLFSEHSLRKCDIVFKRAFSTNSKATYSNKYDIRPFGPNHFTKIEDLRVLRVWKKVKIQQLLFKTLINPIKFFRKLGDFILFPKKGQISSTISHSKYKRNITPSQPYIFFQVAYHDWGSNEEAQRLNVQRAELIRSMKNNFGEQFVGGMFFHGNIPEEYNDCITDVNPNPTIYKLFVKAASIVISTNGFGQSIPWKLTEYMQWGCCIVSEKPSHSFRERMNEHCFLQFTSLNEAIEQCKLLLKDQEKRVNLANNAKKYYNEHIEPSSSILDILKSTFDQTPEFNSSI